ncbi:MAG TPA: globin family protein [Haliangium sp.]|nr:globin family protein [Haliangium sp.]
MATSGDRLSHGARGTATRPPQAPGVSRAPAGAESLDAHTIALVQSSWVRVMPISDAAATLFYDRLFALDPSVKVLFKSDMREQKKKLMQTLGVAVDGLRNIPRLVPVLEQLGARHAGYMVQDRHYDLVGQALLWALREGLGDAFTPELEAAWKRVYGLLAGVMRRAGAAQAEGEPGEQTMPSEPVLMTAASSGRMPASGAMNEDEWPSLEIRGDSGRVTFAPDVRPPDARTVELVQASWARVVPIADAAATLFYERLFALDPSVKTLFKSDMREQRKKLMQTLGVAVDGLRTPAKLLPVLQNLGSRHAGYMVQDRHYDLVGQALLWTLREGLGDDFTPELESAWKRVYGFVAGVMRRGAQPRPPTAAEEKATIHYALPGSPAEAPARDRASVSDVPPAPPAMAPAPAVAPAAPAAAVTAPAGLIIPVSAHDRVLDVRLSFAGPVPSIVPAVTPAPAATPTPAPPPAVSLATALLLAVTCGTLVVLGATAALFGLRTLAGVAVMPAGATYALPAALMVTSIVVFFLGYSWGRRSGAGKDAEHPR